MQDIYDNDFDRKFDEAVDAIEKKEHRLIWADKLKAHYAWWKGGTREMTMDEAKSDFDAIIDLQPTADIDAITKAHADIGYEQGYRDGCAESIMYDTGSWQTTVTDLPPVGYAPIKHGRWVHKYGDGHEEPAITGGECSICGYIHTATNYCPNCGAKMDLTE